jgi:hypothetical protein
MTREEIIAWSDEAGRQLTPEKLSAVKVTARQQARVKELRWKAAEHARRQQNQQSSTRTRQASRAAYGG